MGAPTPDETILGILAARPQHGYQLLEHFNQPGSLGRVWSMSTSQVYAVLKRLETAGLVVGEIVVVPDAPARTEYALTELGKRRLQAWLFDKHPSPSIRRVRIECLSRLYVANLLGLKVGRIIRYQREACQRLHDEMREKPTGPDPRSTDAVLAEFIQGQLQAAIQWLDRLEKLYTEEHPNAQ